MLVPAMYLFASSGGKDAANEAHALLRHCREDGTTGTRCIASVIEGVLKRAGSAR